MANASPQSEKVALFQDAWYGEPPELHAVGYFKYCSLSFGRSLVTAQNNIARTHGKEALVKLIGEESAKL